MQKRTRRLNWSPTIAPATQLKDSAFLQKDRHSKDSRPIAEKEGTAPEPASQSSNVHLQKLIVAVGGCRVVNAWFRN
jgi:hypothetical protein